MGALVVRSLRICSFVRCFKLTADTGGEGLALVVEREALALFFAGRKQLRPHACYGSA